MPQKRVPSIKRIKSRLPIEKGGKNKTGRVASSENATLKVGSCPNDDTFVQIFFYPFLCSIQIFLFSESVPAKKTARFC